MPNSINFGILGYGYVGRATHFGILKNQQCEVHDISFKTTREVLKNCDCVFICIPTESAQDVTLLKNEIESLLKINSFIQIVIRSTMPIGSCDQIEKDLKIKILYIPEFLRERSWDIDCQKRPLIVGSSDAEIPDWLSTEEIIRCSLKEAELIKLFSNNFSVMKIAFANLFYDLSKKVGADYDVVKNSYLKIAHDQSYINIPGHDGTRGFGGKCLPKDLNFTINTLDENNLDSSQLKQIRELNKEWQKKF